MILVDTSAWIEFFRDRDPVASRVDVLLESNDAAVCGPVLTELRRGFRSASDRARVLPLLEAVHLLAQPASLWEEAGDIGFSIGRKGVAVKTVDLLIAAYALSHSVQLLTTDGDFSLLQRAGVPLALAPTYCSS
jgi:predicted nucleic acid-binding protein